MFLDHLLSVCLHGRHARIGMQGIIREVNLGVAEKVRARAANRSPQGTATPPAARSPNHGSPGPALTRAGAGVRGGELERVAMLHGLRCSTPLILALPWFPPRPSSQVWALPWF